MHTLNFLKLLGTNSRTTPLHPGLQRTTRTSALMTLNSQQLSCLCCCVYVAVYVLTLKQCSRFVLCNRARNFLFIKQAHTNTSLSQMSAFFFFFFFLNAPAASCSRCRKLMCTSRPQINECRLARLSSLCLFQKGKTPRLPHFSYGTLHGCSASRLGRNDPLLVFVVLDSRLDCVLGQHRTVQLYRWQLYPYFGKRKEKRKQTCEVA